VLDQDRSAASHELLAVLDGSGVFRRVAQLYRATDIDPMIDDRRALLVIQIGQDFERRLTAGRPADVQVIADGRNSNTAGVALNYVNDIVGTFNAGWASARGARSQPISVTTRAWYNANLETRWYMIPGLIGTLSLLQTLLVTALSVAREREQGTFDQLLVTPYRAAEIIIGKALPSVLIGMVQASLILLVAQLWFRSPFAGSYVTLYAGLALFLLAAVRTIDIAHRVYLEGASFAQLSSDLWPMAVIACDAVMLARQRYESGVTTFLGVLDAERNLQQSELSLADSTAAVSTDLVALYKALGGGWEMSEM
jgi:ABC-2 type transport system permease protein